jgi:hypothetical protein
MFYSGTLSSLSCEGPFGKGPYLLNGPVRVEKYGKGTNQEPVAE